MRRTTVLYLVLAAAVALAAGSAGAQGQTSPASVDCESADNGATFVTDSGLTVAYNASVPMPETGPFQGPDGFAVGDLTVTGGAGAVEVRNATMPVCLGNVNATATPLRVTVGDTTVVLEGEFQRLSVRPIRYDSGVGGADVAYEADAETTVRVIDTGLPTGAALRALADAEAVATATVDESGDATLTLSTGTAAVDLVVAADATTTTTADTTTTTESTGIGIGVPGFGPVEALVALAAAALLASRRQGN